MDKNKYKGTMVEKCLCRLNLHDFEIIKRKNEGLLIKYLEKNLYQNYDIKTNITTNVLETKVCLRCGKIIDEIEQFTKDYIEGKMEDGRRQRTATKLYGSRR